MKIGKILKNTLIFSENIYIQMKKVSFERSFYGRKQKIKF